MEKILIIIPAYNEEESIINTYQSIVIHNQIAKTNYDVIVINDGSNDKTRELCFKEKIPMISLIHNLGIGGAVQTGYKYAFENGYDIAVQFDGDGQHDINYVENIVRPIIEHEANFVIGSRFINQNDNSFKSSFLRRIGIKLISISIKLVTGKKILDTTSGFRAVNKEIIEDFALSYPTEYPEPITTTELLKKNHKFKEVSVKMNERDGGKSSISTWKTVYYMVNVVFTILIIGVRRYHRVN